MGGSHWRLPCLEDEAQGGARQGMEEARVWAFHRDSDPKDQGQLRGCGLREEQAAVSWVGQVQILLRSPEPEVEN